MCRFEFTKKEIADIKSKIYLNEEEEKILDMKLLDYSITKMANEMNMSEASISRRIKRIKEEHSIKHSASDIYLVINSLYNDYHEILGEDNDTYIKMTKLWLNDTDAVEDKTYLYFCNIPKED